MYLGHGIGFPNSIVSPAFPDNLTNYDPYEPPSKKDVEMFWNNWWDRAIKSPNGNDGWDSQLKFIEKVIESMKNKKSIIAFELK